MGALTNTQATILLEGFDLQAQANALSLDYKSETADATVFGCGTRIRKGTLKAATLAAKGFVGNGAIDLGLWSSVGADSVVTVFPTTITEGATTTKGFAGTMDVSKLNIGGPLASLLPFDLAADGSGTIYRAICLKDFRATALSATGVGTAFQLGAITAGQALYSGVHITSVSGTGTPTISMRVQSASDQAFTTEATRVIMADTTAADGILATAVAGPITDTWWRARWAITGTSPQFTGVVWMAIL